MKKVTMFIAVVFIAAASMAAIQVNWGNTAFLSGLDAGSGDPETSTFATADGFKIVWDLVWTTGSAVTPSYDATTGDIAYDAYGSATLLSRRLWEGGTSITVTDEFVRDAQDKPTSLADASMDTSIANADGGNLVYVSNSSFGSGSLYSAVFQYIGDASAGTIYYALTPLCNFVNYDPEKDAATLSSVMFGEEPQPMMTPLKELGGYGVPEPATMSLLGLGALGMVLRRKLRK